MNTKWLSLILWVLASWPALSQDKDHLFPIVEGDKLGFIDSSGKERIPPRFDGYACGLRTAPQFSEGLAPVNVGGKLGYVDETGKVAFVLPYQFMDPYSFREGVALVQVRTNAMGMPDIWVWIDRTGRVLYSDTRGWREEFHEGLMKHESGHYWGYVDHSFRWVIPPQYQSAEDFSEGLALVRTASEGNPDSVYIDRTGKIVLGGKGQYSGASSFADGLARTSVTPTSGPKAWQSRSQFIDHSGHEIIPDLQLATFRFSEGYAFVGCVNCQQARWAVIDKHGKQLTAAEFEAVAASEFHEGLALMFKGSLRGYIDPAGTWVIAPEFDDAHDFSNGLALVWSSRKREFAYIDRSGQIVWRGSDRCQYPMP